MTAFELCFLIVLTIIVVGMLVNRAIAAWEAKELAKSNMKRNKEGNITRVM